MAYNKFYKMEKKAQMHRSFYDMSHGIQHMYYTGNATAIIVTINNVEYYFDSLKDAKSKLKRTLTKDKNYRNVIKEVKDDFTFDPETGLYRRLLNEVA